MNAFCTLQHSTIESSYVSLVATISESNNSSEIKSPLDDQAIDFSIVYFLYISFMNDLSFSLSFSISIQHVI